MTQEDTQSKTRRRTLQFFTASIGVLSAGCTSMFEGNDDEKENVPQTYAGSDESTRDDISMQYSLGLQTLDAGKAGIQSGVIDFNMEMYDSAVETFESTKETFSRAEDQFSEAVDLTYEIENSEARNICETGESNAITLSNAAEQYQQAASRASEGANSDVVNNRISEAESLENEAERSPPREQSVLDNVLNSD